MSNGGSRPWLVLLEAADELQQSTVDRAGLARLVASWGGPAPATLYSPNRYALQVSVWAADPPSALSAAIHLWQDALARTELPAWDLVRVEVMTPEEREKELQAAEWRGDGGTRPAVAHDVVAEDLLRRALHDSLTGLPSRELFVDGLRTALGADGPASTVQAVMVVQLDGGDSSTFSVGSAGRNDVVSEIARFLSEVCRRSDLVARIGDAEFAVLVEANSDDDAVSLAQRIVERFRCPLWQESQAADLRASLGVATSSSAHDADELIGMAEAAMTLAREAGGDCHRLFQRSRDSHLDDIL